MKPAPVLIVSLLLSCLAAARPVSSRQETEGHEPLVGQSGKDVAWIPSPNGLIADMLDMAKVAPEDYLIDLGSGDGRIVIAAAKRGARALGIELDPDLVQLSRDNAQAAGVAGKASFQEGDIFKTDFSQATVVTMYLLPSLNLRLRPRILAMKPGTRIVSHAFSMADWKPDQTVTQVSEEERTAYLWIVPAKVGGAWTWQAPSGDAVLMLKQTFQRIEGVLTVDGHNMPLGKATLEGDLISFATGSETRSTQYSGRVNGSVIDGTMRIPNGQAAKWLASRLPAAE